MAYSLEAILAAQKRAEAAGAQQEAEELGRMADALRLADPDVRAPGLAAMHGATLGIGTALVPGAREELEAYREQEPGAALGMEVVGGLGAGAGIGAAVGRLAQLPGRTGAVARWLSQPRVAPQATLGAAEGAVMGASEEGASGAGLGAATGAIGGAVAAPVTRWATQRLRPGVKSEDMLRAELRETLGREPTPADFEAWSQRAELRPELTFAEVPGGDVLPRQAETLWTQGGAAGRIIDETVEARRRGGTDRLLEALAGSTGTDESITAASNRLQEQARTDASPLYRAAFGTPFEPDEGLLALTESPRRRQLIRRGYEAAREQADVREGRILPDFKDVVEGGYEDMSLEAWDQVKRGLDAAYVDQRRKSPSRAANTLRFKNLLLEEIDRIAPDEYRQARALYRGPAAAEEALEQGQRILSSDADFIEDVMRQYSQSEREGYAIGAAQAIRNKLKTVPLEGGMPRFTQLLEDRIRALYPDPADFDRFWDAVTQEREMQQFRNLFKGQSRTAPRLAGAERQRQLMGAGAGLMQAMQGAPIEGARQMAASLRPPTQQIPSHIADPLARMLMTRGSGVRPMLGRLERPPIMPRAWPSIVTTGLAPLTQEARRWLEQ